MMTEITVAELRENLEAWLERVAQGEEIRILKDDEPFAELLPLTLSMAAIEADLAELDAELEAAGVSFDENPIVALRREYRY